jgi:endonuclease/exonuclease/phosphatase family metal-dependent hydrolase
MAEQKLKIATWNLARPTISNNRKNTAILGALRKVDADIVVLTETNSCINLQHDGYPTCFSTTCLFQSLAVDGGEYKQGENRVTIWSTLPGRRRIDMCNSHSAICAEISTAVGKLNVYGTIIGIYGKNRGRYEPKLPGTDFEISLEVQLSDWKRLSRLGDLCIAGDFNQCFGKGPYFTERHRQRILKSLEELEMDVPTVELPNNIDQIAISRSFLNSFRVTGAPETWHDNIADKKTTDHQGVFLTLERA